MSDKKNRENLYENFEEEGVQINTDRLQKRFAEEDDLDTFLKENLDYFADDALHTSLVNILDRSGYKMKDLLDYVYIDSSYVYQIFKGKRMPSRNKLLQILLFFKLPIKEINRILKIGEHSPLYIKNMRDVVIIHGINKSMDLDEINFLLEEKNMETLER